MSEQVHVEIDLDGRTALVGEAYFHVTRSQISTTFKYADEFLGSRQAYPISPELSLSVAPISVPGLPGAFSDSAPDRWGRNLVAKQHRRRVAQGDARDRRLTEVDYLLGVSDTTRQGALRFRRTSTTEYLRTGASVPRTVSLPELQHAADEATDGSGAAIKRLLDAGTGSLGGARPKASVAGDSGALMIAKFTRPSDDWSVILWERLALEIAQSSGVAVPHAQLVRIDARPVLLLDRFDRQSARRIGYMSAMTASERRDGEHADYVDIVEAIEDTSSRWRRDCRELFRRMALSSALHNTDDHLRNHGFLRSDAGWELSPAFDINPEPDLAVERQTAINGVTEAEHEAEALLEFAPLCHLTISEARTILSEVTEAVSRWEDRANALAVPSRELTFVGDAMNTQLSRLRAVLRAAL
ncbi:type II toxin-antitoxin system HipA family toxin [Brevibacterium atlanticum]|uniref:type II toxin-antitoxin system HipA family toxin n=1 Tax=Brevibacterium atlanticum TaxID=2697563 RepID=UPI001423A063|nr:type II toxin-antitoxin system HipA family toxin [Brevibacterium atlanticum]